ncbi:MAG TPA: GNAT family N-acetyltransferase [Coriobacteriia bacterium]|jgi:ribosomal protein S18 acetylase RimI-like enzyme
MTLDPLSPASAEAVVSRFSLSRLLDGPPYDVTPRHALALSEVLSAADAPGASAVVLESGGQPRGLAVLRASEWDGAHFGFPVGRLEHMISAGPREASDLAEWVERRCADLGLRFCSTVLPAEDLHGTHALEAAGWRYQETRLHPWLALAGAAWESSPRVRPANEADTEAVARMARTAFSADRFHNDPGFDAVAADAFYERWAREWFAARDPQRRAWVLEAGGTIAGFFLVRIVEPAPGAPAVADLVLTAIDTSLGRRGLGTELWSAALDALTAEAAYCATTISARNTAVVNLYAKLGFRFGRTETALHRWFDA